MLFRSIGLFLTLKKPPEGGVIYPLVDRFIGLCLVGALYIQMLYQPNAQSVEYQAKLGLLSLLLSYQGLVVLYLRVRLLQLAGYSGLQSYCFYPVYAKLYLLLG